jgi:hydrogenase nickel incorporation protein HypB
LVHYALRDLPLEQLDLVIVENVGNLVCPAEFDIGEKAKIAVLSVTEGEDKPVKYPLLFREAAAAVVTKTDLLPYLPFNLATCLDYIRQVNGALPVYQVSALSGGGMEAWAAWLLGCLEGKTGA